MSGAGSPEDPAAAPEIGSTAGSDPVAAGSGIDRGADSRTVRLIEALLFSAAEPIREADLAQRLPDPGQLDPALKILRRLYENRGVELHRAGDAWAFRTAPDLGDALRIERSTVRKLSRAAVETLAVIAYHQPVTRAEIEEIRGVGQSRGTLDLLLEAGWIKPGRRRQTPGRPLTWITTQSFLDHFGLENVGDLPGIADLKASGLLDKRPAIEAFRNVAGDDTPVDAENAAEAAEDADPAEAAADTD